MLSGEPPFAGNTSTVMRAHREESPRHLRERANKVPKRVAGVVMSALSKVRQSVHRQPSLLEVLFVARQKVWELYTDERSRFTANTFEIPKAFISRSHPRYRSEHFDERTFYRGEVFAENRALAHCNTLRNGCSGIAADPFIFH
jgi:hypothetical protein